MAREDAFECRKCGKRFGKEAKLARHMQESHSVAKSPVLFYGAGVVVLAIVAVGAFAAISNVETPKPIDLNLKGQPSLGNDSAPVVLLLFEDPNCPFCKRFHDETLEEIVRNFVSTGTVQVFFRQFSGGNPWTFEGSIAQECVFLHEGNDAFWNVTRFFYENQFRITTSNLRQTFLDFAGQQSWNSEALSQCFDGRETGNEVSRDFAKGRELGGRGTPTFFVAKRDSAQKPTLISGAQPYAVFASAIQRALAGG